MASETSIEWTDATWNPVRGCSRVSRGCEHCYAETVAGRFSGPGQPYEGLVRLRASGKHGRAQWNGVVRLVPEHLADPLRWTKPRKVFVNSMSDLFHEALPFESIAAIFGVMAASPKHTFQVLTKRPKRAREFFAWLTSGFDGPDAHAQREAAKILGPAFAPALHKVKGTLKSFPWPLPNVWLGVSVEDQATADERIPHLLECPAAVRFVSYEPALGPVDFSRWLGVACSWGHVHPRGVGTYMPGECPAFIGSFVCGRPLMSRLDWVIVGGESGPGARPFDLAWARSVIEQCRAPGVPVFVKQLGADPRGNGRDVRPMRVNDDGTPAPSGMRECRLHLRNRKGGDMSEWPEDLRVRHAFVRAVGRLR